MSDERPDVVIVDNRAWPLLAGQRYQFTGEELQQLLTEVGGATSRVFLEEDGEKVMPADEVAIAIHAFAVESTQTWAKAYDRAQGVLGAGSLTLGSAGVETMRRLIDGEGTPAEHDQMRAILDAAIEAGEKAEDERAGRGG